MASARFDIFFAGELLAEADEGEVRLWLQRRFKLSEKATARLFDGRPRTIKRDVNTATASRFREIFREAGALIKIHPIAAPSDSLPSSTADLPDTSDLPCTTDVPTTTALPYTIEALPLSETIKPERQTRADPDGVRGGDSTREDPPAEHAPDADLPLIDTSHLSLVPGRDWTLEDCQPPLPPIRLPDTSHLHLVMPELPEIDESAG